MQTIKAAHIATVRKLAKPPHLIMRIMDCVLLLFQKKVDSVTLDPDRPCPRPSWAESLKVRISHTLLSSSILDTHNCTHLLLSYIRMYLLRNSICDCGEHNNIVYSNICSLQCNE